MPPKHVDPQELEGKDLQDYKLLVRIVDNHEYPRGVRFADGILSKHPLHAETMAQKALALHGVRTAKKNRGVNKPKDDQNDNQQENNNDGAVSEEDPLVMVKEALKLNPKSAVCWHAMGQLHRADNNYAEAMRCYKMGMRNDPKVAHPNIARDVSLVGIILSDWESYSEAREKLLGAGAQTRSNWLSHAMGHHKLGHYEVAGSIIDTMCDVLEPGETKQEKTEIFLYRAENHLLCGHPEKAIALLDKERDSIVDAIAKAQVLSRAHLMVAKRTGSDKHKKKAEEHVFALLKDQVEERDMIYRLAEIRGHDVKPLNSSKHSGVQRVPANEAFVKTLDEVAQQFPKCDPAARLALDYAPLDQFEGRLRKYLSKYVVKMIPSAVSVLKSLYVDPERVAIIQKVVLEWEGALRGRTVHPDLGDKAVGNPVQHLMALQFLASHYCRLRDFANATLYIDQAIAHSPTVEMLYLLRAKILYRQGQVNEAADAADKARLLDLQDKYINTKAVKYLIRANRAEEGDARLALFHRPAEWPGGQKYTMFDMQTRWYEKEQGDNFLKQGDVIRALEMYLLNERHAKGDLEACETLNFHAMRRGHLRAWIDAVGVLQKFPGTVFSLDLAPRIIRAYLTVHDEGEEATRKKHTPREPVPVILDGEERQRIEAGHQLIDPVALDTPLDRCTPYLKSLQAHRPNSSVTHAMLFEVSLRANRPLGCVSALRQLKRLSGEFKAAKQSPPEEVTEGAIADRRKRLDQWLAGAEGKALDSRVAALVKEAL